MIYQSTNRIYIYDILIQSINSVYLSIYPSVYLYVYLYVYLFIIIYLSVCPSVCRRSVRASIHPSIHALMIYDIHDVWYPWYMISMIYDIHDIWYPWYMYDPMPCQYVTLFLIEWEQDYNYDTPWDVGENRKTNMIKW